MGTVKPQVKVYRAAPFDPTSDAPLKINAPLVARWLTEFLLQEVTVQRGIGKAVLGLSGGVDSAVTAFLCARAFGPENVLAVRMPYKSSSPSSLSDAQTVIDQLGIQARTVDITDMVDGYACAADAPLSPLRLGNVCARCRMTVLFDVSAELGALPIGTGNKTERYFGYFTWHADDAPAINPLGDLFKTQVWQLAKVLGVPASIVSKPPSADLVPNQTDEGDFGLSYHDADRILIHVASGVSVGELVGRGFDRTKVERVASLVAKTHWKRHLPTIAMLSDTAINEYYLRPVDYR